MHPVDLRVPARFTSASLEEDRSITLPPGFSANVYASGVPGARFMAIGANGDVFVTAISAGRVHVLPDRDKDGVADRVDTWASGLSAPHGIAIHEGYLYVGETHQVVRFRIGTNGERASDAEVVIPDLPSGRGHRTRTIGFGPDGKLYVSVGSSCNVCEETDERRAAISVYNPDGTGGRIFARGLRNAVGFVWRPGSNEMYATNNGRDHLGDDMPPETIYKVVDGMDAGWPHCNPVRQPDPQLGRDRSCADITDPAVLLPAHNAPLGLRFYQGAQFPQKYRGNLFVALHGSWNRTRPDGYKVVRVPFVNGNPTQPVEFATGFIPDDRDRSGVWARPVDLIEAPDGALLMSDDEGGTILRFSFLTATP